MCGIQLCEQANIEVRSYDQFTLQFNENAFLEVQELLWFTRLFKLNLTHLSVQRTLAIVYDDSMYNGLC